MNNKSRVLLICMACSINNVESSFESVFKNNWKPVLEENFDRYYAIKRASLMFEGDIEVVAKLKKSKNVYLPFAFINNHLIHLDNGFDFEIGAEAKQRIADSTNHLLIEKAAFSKNSEYVVLEGTAASASTKYKNSQVLKKRIDLDSDRIIDLTDQIIKFLDEQGFERKLDTQNQIDLADNLSIISTGSKPRSRSASIASLNSGHNTPKSPSSPTLRSRTSSVASNASSPKRSVVINDKNLDVKEMPEISPTNSSGSAAELIVQQLSAQSSLTIETGDQNTTPPSILSSETSNANTFDVISGEISPRNANQLVNSDSGERLESSDSTVQSVVQQMADSDQDMHNLLQGNGEESVLSIGSVTSAASAASNPNALSSLIRGDQAENMERTNTQTNPQIDTGLQQIIDQLGVQGNDDSVVEAGDRSPKSKMLDHVSMKLEREHSLSEEALNNDKKSINDIIREQRAQANANGQKIADLFNKGNQSMTIESKVKSIMQEITNHSSVSESADIFQDTMNLSDKTITYIKDNAKLFADKKLLAEFVVGQEKSNTLSGVLFRDSQIGKGRYGLVHYNADGSTTLQVKVPKNIDSTFDSALKAMSHSLHSMLTMKKDNAITYILIHVRKDSRHLNKLIVKDNHGKTMNPFINPNFKLLLNAYDSQNDGVDFLPCMIHVTEMTPSFAEISDMTKFMNGETINNKELKKSINVKDSLRVKDDVRSIYEYILKKLPKSYKNSILVLSDIDNKFHSYLKNEFGINVAGNDGEYNFREVNTLHIMHEILKASKIYKA
ncbi:hypothetical protein [Candidatus Cytomitobacter primus]|uniref:Uncharacterized protein n=1 Tax=Candidatus Cytomitobacter primus TaxID=2066024 RepID=A0A5C0UEB9_9PROT|nr:hypothetical protein [Candidatus Cytomitobacter primus]QEK38436.1 hypothetical protein FZC34_00685 [Candidatus Cytomitobacter primus]